MLRSNGKQSGKSIQWHWWQSFCEVHVLQLSLIRSRPTMTASVRRPRRGGAEPAQSLSKSATVRAISNDGSVRPSVCSAAKYNQNTVLSCIHIFTAKR